MPLGLGPLELLVILVIVLIVVGPGKLPGAGAAIGKAIREFREALEGTDQSRSQAQGQAPQPPQPSQQQASSPAPEADQPAQGASPGTKQEPPRQG